METTFEYELWLYPERRRKATLRFVGYRTPSKGELYVSINRGHNIVRSNGRCTYASFIFEEVPIYVAARSSGASCGGCRYKGEGCLECMP